MGLGADIVVACVDIAEGGIGLVVNAGLMVGDVVELTFHAQGFGRPVKRGATVVWRTGAGQDLWRAGLTFDKALSYSELQRLTTS
jgi:hypothetical protein